MENYNYKVIAEIRPDLSEAERSSVVNEMKSLQAKLKIVNIDNVTYCKAQPIKGHDDFGAVAFFYAALCDMKDCFSKLEHYDLWEDRVRVAVEKLDVSSDIHAFRDEEWAEGRRETSDN